MPAPIGTGILDTSTFIWLERIPDREAVLPARMTITSITLAELAVGPLVTDDADERTQRQEQVQDALLMDRLAFDDACAHAYGTLAAALRRDGRKRRARAFDALIAATAIANGLPLYTGNPDDFDGIPGLDLRPVPAPEG
ncbi:MAG: type II toxin-antitoxin system VapC family toxin [Solirubrobacteraceae bacterium]